MNVFDVLGPVMVGPSSSHTAGAARIGFVTRELLGQAPIAAVIALHGSFAATGVGHGTNKAIVGGLLGMRPNDIRIPESFDLASKAGLSVEIKAVKLHHVHPNTALLNVKGAGGRQLELVASSLGGGRILVVRLDDIETNFSANRPTIVLYNLDQPGHAAAVTNLLSQEKINIAAMQLYRNMRGGYAVMVLECDEEVPLHVLRMLEKTEGILRVTYLNMEE